jgi:hypothetical protein
VTFIVSLRGTGHRRQKGRATTSWVARLGAGGAAELLVPLRRCEMHLRRGVGDGCDVRAGYRGATRWVR